MNCVLCELYLNKSRKAKGSEMLIHATIWINLENIRLSRKKPVSQWSENVPLDAINQSNHFCHKQSYLEDM